MRIMNRVRRTALATIGGSAVLASVALMAPGSASAVVVNCASPLNGTGSSLQKEQQLLKWIPAAEAITGLKNDGTNECGKAGLAEKIVIKYAPEGSGAGLTEFGLEGLFELTPALGIGAKLDGFIGTDDPPTAGQIAEALKVVAKHAGTDPAAIAVAAAPVALIFHLPEGCELAAASKEPNVTQKDVEELWLKKGMSWKKLLETDGKAKLTETAAKLCASVAETEAAKAEVRSDGSGTSYAFKQWLCQVSGASATWSLLGAGNCEEDTTAGAFINDSKEWPAAVNKSEEFLEGGVKKPNEKGSGEALSVCETVNSFGYANTADAAANCPFAAGKAGSTKFWVKVENGELEAGEPVFEDPITGTGAGNCSSTFALTAAQLTAAEKGEWETVHMAAGVGLGHKITGYPICTLTYDVGWESYVTTELQKEYGGLVPAEEVGASALAYFWWLLEPTGGQLAANIEKFFAPDPVEVREASQAVVKNLMTS